MKTKELFTILNEHRDKSLLFQYTPGQLVGANYHITEVKHIKIDSVDCGARKDNWNETVIQLWESPSELGKTQFMSAKKAHGILNKVGKMKSYDLDSEVKFEYGNQLFHTAQLFVNDYEIHGENLMFTLAVQKTACKAEDICGIENTTNKTVQATEATSCAPGSGCC